MPNQHQPKRRTIAERSLLIPWPTLGPGPGTPQGSVPAVPLEPEISKISQEQVYRWISEQIAREDGLVNSRFNWTLTFQGFLFAALAIIAGNETDSVIRDTLKWLLPAVGVLSSLLAWQAVEAAIEQLYLLRLKLNEFFHDPAGEHRCFVRPTGYEAPHFWGNLYPRAMPLLMVLTWISVFVFFGVKGSREPSPIPKAATAADAAIVTGASPDVVAANKTAPAKNSSESNAADAISVQSPKHDPQ
ncbi:MAG: hypothetical protein IT581_03590 [Verrucomicrobiales bacterium]|nr:hypothetical protein [Verrucomicrobiales bacterium]